MFNRSPKGEGYECPQTGFRERCNNGRGGMCPNWVRVLGKHPQTGADIDMKDCALQWIPILLIEIARRENETGAAVESFRNEVQRGNAEAVQAMSNAVLQVPALKRNDGVTYLQSRP